MADRFMCSLVLAFAGSGACEAVAVMPCALSDLVRFVHEGRPPSRMRSSLLASACYPPDLPAAVRAQLEEETGLLPPTLVGVDQRFWIDVQVWAGEGLQGPSNQASPAHLTYSFPDDGVSWGGLGGRPVGLNVLNDRLASTFSAEGLDKGRELIRQALASYSKYCGLSYDEVADDGAAMSTDVVRSPLRGDVRIGGFDNPCNCAAYNAFPSDAGLADIGGADMCLNTIFFTPTQYQNPENHYRWLRNVVAHEHGHGVGNIHAIPCDGTKSMEPFINLGFDMLQIDDRRGIARSYGDRFAGNHSPASATDLGTLDAAAPTSAVLRHLSLNGAAGPNNTDEDWFRFTFRGMHNLSVSAVPAGGSYSAGQQMTSCGGTEFVINANSAGNLEVQLYASNGTTLLQSVNTTSNGQSETLTSSGLAPGAYYIRVRDRGFNTPVNQYVQLYSLFVRVDGALAAPTAVAGLNKRCRANTNCWFMGDINSYTNDGLVNSIQNYEWDRDGDGAFEVANAPQTSFVFPSNGLYTVTLRVTDMIGKGTDSIQVEVFGGVTLVDLVLPPEARPGESVPITIFGRNLKNVASALEIAVGPGITVSGTPVPDLLGTRVDGLRFTVQPFAELGPRNVTISNPDGSDTGFGLFAVIPPGCEGDADQDGDVTFSDITAVLQNYGSQTVPGGRGDANRDGLVNFADVTSVLERLAVGCG